MARGGVNKAVVRIARDALLARGAHPSIDAVRVELGNTGSKTTIQRYLKELGHFNTPEPAMPLSEELTRYISSLVERLTLEAQAALAEDRVAFEVVKAAAQQAAEFQRAQLQQLQRANEMLVVERREGVAMEQSLVLRLQAVDLECHRLQEADRQQTQLLEERAAQIRSLEDKYRYTQEALEHFRTQHLIQREQEGQRHEAQVQHLQRELRSTQEHLLSKQEELSQLYRDLERMSGEQLRQHQEYRRLEQSVQSIQDQLRDANAERQREAQQLLHMAHQITALREKAKHQLLRQRQDQRQIRTLRRELGPQPAARDDSPGGQA